MYIHEPQGVRYLVPSAALPRTSPGPRDNRLLAALPDDSYGALAPFLERVDMRLGSVLYESEGPRRYVYFPATSIVSLLYVLRNGASAEFAVTGNEGFVGLSVFMSGETASNRAAVQTAGWGYQIRASVFRREVDRSVPLQRLLLRYAQALISQMAQTAVCNRHHNVEQQFCRLLLFSLDRLPANELAMTQERIAGMLGVRRVGVTEAAGRLQADGLIEYRRGRITVLDREALEERACECYAIVKREYHRLLSTGLPVRGTGRVRSARSPAEVEALMRYARVA
jgi:CRP-like cAMP-binding protein